ncbi:oligoendopeptidase F [Candidatus Bathyarchaeota archaeon]|nr:oligoendopeptidase F [Candidatus Bathyarchaeota archaeon]
MSITIPLRKDIPREHTWSVETIFPSDEAWAAEFDALSRDLPSLEKFKGKITLNAKALVEWFEASEAIQFRAGKIGLYANLRYSSDTSDQNAVALNDRARGIVARVASAISFAEPELILKGFKTLNSWLLEELKLKKYKHYFDRLENRAAHVRSAEVEEILSALNDPFRTSAAIHNILNDADLKFTPATNSQGATFEITQSNINSLKTNPDRTLRQTSFQNYADGYLAFKNTVANCLTAGVKQDVFKARAQHYSSSLEAALEPNFIPLPVFHSLIKTFQANLPTWHRYWGIRKKALNYDQFYVYDEKAPLTKTKPKLEYNQAVDWICNGLRPLGEEYVTVARKGMLEDRWVDKYPNKGKRSGAFSSGVPGTHPFISMSFNNDIFGMSTLAHELGHSMHSYFTMKIQPYVYRGYGTFLAEVASNFNQAMVRAWLLKNTPASQIGVSEKEFKIAVIEEAMSNFHRYFFIMPTLAKFELEIHERVERGQALTAKNMTDLLAELFKQGYGDGVVFDHDRVGITWSQFPTHLYSNFYVFQYATGISAAHALAQKILDNKPNSVEKYLEFLSTGGAKFPLDTLKEAGVDLTSPEPVETAFKIFAGYVDLLKELTISK